MALDVYLNFNGNCKDAVDFYAEVFGVEKQPIMTFGESPQDPNYPLPEEAKNLVMHTFLDINGTKVMFSDCFPGMSLTIGNNINLVYISKNIDEMKALFNKLKEGGNVQMELQETFWSKSYGFLTDKFGIGWQFNYDNGEMEK